MPSGDRVSFFLGVGAIVVTLAVGTCSTNARFNDVNARFDDVDARFDDVDARFDDVNARLDDVQEDIRELRALVIEALKRRESAD
ncbi:MAG: hypothetical protein OXG04_15055 [Acidobacteria bacterium]|nr:hypothetical protein [Acidobacteriota bacterium]